MLGPILFSIYVNDMANATLLQPRLFADDTNIFAYGTNIDVLIENTNVESVQSKPIDTKHRENILVYLFPQIE